VKYLPLIRAGFRRRPLNAVLTFISVTSAFILLGLASGFATILPKGGNSPAWLLGGVAAVGFGLVLMLTGNAVAQTVRLRFRDFAVLKALGFPTRLILTLVFFETAACCLAGAMTGLLLAEVLSGPFLSLFPNAPPTPRPFVPLAIDAPSALGALLLAAISTVLPGARIVRLNAAAALRENAT